MRVAALRLALLALCAAADGLQAGFTPLHYLCENTNGTVDLILALHGFYPAAAGEKNEVRPAAPARHAR